MMRYTEMQISSEALDQPDFPGEPKKLFICSTPRSGSYFLCRHMINAGLGVPHEYFNPIIMQQMAPRLGLGDDVRGLAWPPRGRKDVLNLRRAERAAEGTFLCKYIRALLRKRCQGGLFAAKIHYRDFVRVLHNLDGHALLRSAQFIFLYREDMLKQAVSEHFGQLTGRWGIDDSVTTMPAASPKFFNPVSINEALNTIAEQERGWRIFLARQGAVPISTSYESLCKDPFAFMQAIARRLNIDPDTLRQGYTEPAAYGETDPNLPSKAEVARRYAASMQETTSGGPRHALRRLLGA